MQITIITVCYNSEQTISRTIESVFLQNYPYLEYIIIDGASKDKTVEIAYSYKDKFQEKGISYKIYSEPDKGIYDAMNKGISHATGEIIGILNSDDRYVDEYVLSTVAESFENNSNLDTCFGNLLYVKGDKPYRYWKSGAPRTFKFGWMPPHPSFFVRSSVYRKYGLFRLDCGVNADYELMLRFLEKHKVSSVWINQLFVYMEAGGTSNQGIQSRIDGIKDNEQAWYVNNLRLTKFTILLKKIRKIPQFLYAKMIR